MSGGKGAKRTNSGSVGKNTLFLDETNHMAVSLLPNEEGVSTLAPHTLLKAASKHAAKLKENRMLYNVSDAIKAQISGLLDSRDRRVSLRGLERDSSRRHKLCVPCLPRARPKQCSLPLIPFLEGHS